VETFDNGSIIIPGRSRIPRPVHFYRGLPLILYMNGDGHYWSYDNPYNFGRRRRNTTTTNNNNNNNNNNRNNNGLSPPPLPIMRIMVKGGKGNTEAPVRIVVNATGTYLPLRDAFRYQRQR